MKTCMVTSGYFFARNLSRVTYNASCDKERQRERDRESVLKENEGEPETNRDRGGWREGDRE